MTNIIGGARQGQIVTTQPKPINIISISVAFTANVFNFIKNKLENTDDVLIVNCNPFNIHLFQECIMEELKILKRNKQYFNRIYLVDGSPLGQSVKQLSDFCKIFCKNELSMDTFGFTKVVERITSFESKVIESMWIKDLKQINEIKKAAIYDKFFCMHFYKLLYFYTFISIKFLNIDEENKKYQKKLYDEFIKFIHYKYSTVTNPSNDDIDFNLFNNLFLKFLDENELRSSINDLKNNHIRTTNPLGETNNKNFHDCFINYDFLSHLSTNNIAKLFQVKKKEVNIIDESKFSYKNWWYIINKLYTIFYGEEINNTNTNVSLSSAMEKFYPNLSNLDITIKNVTKKFFEFYIDTPIVEGGYKENYKLNSNFSKLRREAEWHVKLLKFITEVKIIPGMDILCLCVGLESFLNNSEDEMISINGSGYFQIWERFNNNYNGEEKIKELYKRIKLKEIMHDCEQDDLAILRLAHHQYKYDNVKFTLHTQVYEVLTKYYNLDNSKFNDFFIGNLKDAIENDCIFKNNLSDTENSILIYFGKNLLDVSKNIVNENNKYVSLFNEEIKYKITGNDEVFDIKIKDIIKPLQEIIFIIEIITMKDMYTKYFTIFMNYIIDVIVPDINFNIFVQLYEKYTSNVNQGKYTSNVNQGNYFKIIKLLEKFIKSRNLNVSISIDFIIQLALLASNKIYDKIVLSN